MKRLLLLISLFLWSGTAFGQFRIEAGMRQANLYFKEELIETSIDGSFPPRPFTNEYAANELWLVPVFRLAYELNASTFRILPFAGYGEYGGADDGSFCDECPPFRTRLQSLQLGSFLLLKMGPASLGPGLTMDFIVRDGTDFDAYSSFAVTGGLRADVTIKGRVPVGIETWYNLTNVFNFGISVHSFTYGVTVGYIITE